MQLVMNWAMETTLTRSPVTLLPIVEEAYGTTKVTVRQSAWNAQFIIEMDEMTDIWGLV